MPVENTGVCPWKDGDEVRVEFEDGMFTANTHPTKWDWSLGGKDDGTIVISQLIKRAEK